ncbi:MAG: hypothetical protein CMO80_18235 [Verrucomicrobiales bacterium]|nr:hypothetical protein [Verrucomicrobiales bacterium]|tara:strand:- start:61 stop:399 length:339 start_codon:yes stop_codon:yes gene_type:complete
MKKEFHHIGLPTHESQPGEFFVEETKVWVTDPRKHPYKVEFLRFEDDSPVIGPVRDMPHIAYRVEDVNAAIQGEDVILEPFEPSPNFTVAFVMKDGAVIEYMQFEKEEFLPW